MLLLSHVGTWGTNAKAAEQWPKQHDVIFAAKAIKGLVHVEVLLTLSPPQGNACLIA
jgi:hypothetical protein